MKKYLTTLFCLLASPIYADTPSTTYQPRGNGFTVIDLDCTVDAHIHKRHDSHCMHVVPEILFQYMCEISPLPSEKLNQKRTCSLGGLRT